MRLLALETATDACSAALWCDGAVAERFALVPQGHSQALLPMVQALLAEAGMTLHALDAVAFGRGPGSFTGLRIGCGVAQGLAFGADLPVVPVSSLAALAQGEAGDRILAAFDARMDQVYWGAYRRSATGLVEAVAAEQVIAPAAVPLPEGGEWLGAGGGWDRYAPVLTARLAGRVPRWHAGRWPHAAEVARLGVAGLAAGAAVAAEHALPVYLRDEVAVKAPPPARR